MKFSTMMAVALASVGAVADTLYVNNVTGNDGNAGTANLPLKTIQAAISTAHPGDVISVAPGIYGDEQGSTPASTAGQTCRVWIDKSITLKSEVKGGAVITGRLADDPQGAVTAIRIADSVATTKESPVVVEGFVIRDCGTDTANAGGVIGWSGTGVPSFADEKGPWVVDCVISNCSITCNGVLGRVNAIRVHLRNNSGTSTGLNAYYCNLAHSVLAGANGQAGLLGSAANVMVNSTVVGGSHIPTSTSNKMCFYNVIMTGGINAGANCTEARNSVFAGTCTGDADGSNMISSSKYNKDQIAAPLYADYRPLVPSAGFCPDAVACGLGHTNWLAKVPERYRWTDFDGRPVVATAEGRIQAGAVQTTVTPVCGFMTEDEALNFDRTFLKAYYPANNRFVYLGESDWPKAYELSADLAEGEHLFAFGANDMQAWRFPNRDGKVLFVPQKGLMTKLTVERAAQVRYVNDAIGSDDDYDGLSATVSGGSGPYKTIQKAIDTVGSRILCTVYVAPGVYDEGESEWSAGTTPRLRVMLASNRRFRIVATSTTEPTVIMGKADTTSATRDAKGNGPNAIRCIRAQSNVIGCLQGFVITGGHTDSASATAVSYKNGGALMCDGSPNFWLMDCVVTNNTCASGGAALYGGRAARCVFKDNLPASNGGGAFATYAPGTLCWLSGCVIAAEANSASQALVGDGVTMVNCTVWSPVTGGRVLTSNKLSYLFNTLVVNNGSIGTADSKCIAGNVLDNTPYVSGKTLNVEPIAFTRGAALLVDPANGDYHVATASAAIGKGSAWGGLSDSDRWTEAVAYSNFYGIINHDFDGNGFNFVNGLPTAGALQRPTKHLMVVSANRAEHVVVDNIGTNFVGFGEKVDLSAEAKDGRQMLGYLVDGEFRPGAELRLMTPGPESSAEIDVRILVNTNWYADAENGSDSGHGWSETDAFRTLAGAMGQAEAGDTVIALPGTYREKSMVQEVGCLEGDSTTLPSRVVIRDGVSLVSRDGAAATVIEGVTPAGMFGEGAIRCVYMRPGSTLRGFTVTGGSTLTYETSGKGDDYGPGGIFCAETANTTVEPSIWIYDCVISNNCGRAYAGGAYNGGGFVRCRFFDNRSQSGEGGGASLVSRIYECVFDRNRGTASCNRPYRTRGCTFGGNDLTWIGNPAPAMANDPSSSATLWPVWNTLFLGGRDCAVRCAYNCIVPREGFLRTDRDTKVWEDIKVAEVAVDADYAPAFDSAAANAAKMDYVLPVELEGDVYGNPRRSNGGMDIGAVETDWRPRYAADLGRRVTVTSADWTVVEGESGTVRLPDGATLSAEWRIRSLTATPSVRFTVADGATLTVVRTGRDPVVFGPGDGEFKLDDPQPLESLSFVADGGTVELASMRSNSGLQLILR